jgi:hypothetical protein
MFEDFALSTGYPPSALKIHPNGGLNSSFFAKKLEGNRMILLREMPIKKSQLLV